MSAKIGPSPCLVAWLTLLECLVFWWQKMNDKNLSRVAPPALSLSDRWSVLASQMQIRCPTITIVIGDHQPQSVITASTPGNQAEGKIQREMTGEGGRREGGKGKQGQTLLYS